MLRLITYLWALPNTILGLLFVPLAVLSGGRVRRRGRVVEIAGGVVQFFLERVVPLRGGALALTLGHVILGRNEPALDRCRRHEMAHVAQYERWGPLFIPAYLLSGLVSFFQGRGGYTGNRFEQEARSVSGRTS